jgi:hypothetical protein
MVVDEHEPRSGRQSIVGVEDQLVAAGGRLGANVELRVGGRRRQLLGRVRDARESVHQRVDLLGWAGVLAAQRRVGLTGEAVGVLSVPTHRERAQRLGQDGGERIERRLGLEGNVGRHQIVFTG